MQKKKTDQIGSVKQPFWAVTGDIGECLLCGRPPATIGLFVPDAPSDFGVKQGQAIAYLLCDSCWEDGPRIDYVEATIRGRQSGQPRST